MTTAPSRTAAQAPFFGAVPSQDGVRFRVWAPDARVLELVLYDGEAAGTHPLANVGSGLYETWVERAAAGNRYAYRLDDNDLPDPASRFQPEGVHGSSQVIDPLGFRWTDERWRIRALEDLILYELHVGTFTSEGTFAGVQARLPYLRDLGITAIELMPVADFAGARNWGYDGVALFAPSRAYGTPDDLRGLVDAAHHHGLAVILDVVYNHLGPEGAYLSRFSHRYFNERHGTPWGATVNLDGEGSEFVRRFILDSALHWVSEYHLDGLRLDATHALVDENPRHIFAELAHQVREVTEREVILHAEDERNLAAIVQGPAEGGWGLHGVWADDFHHVVRRLLTGDGYGYFVDFEGTTDELARTIRQGWLYTGQHSAHHKRGRGTDPAGVPISRFIVCLQNHDQVGNRATGDRLHHQIHPDAWRAVSTVLLMVPMTPLLFMGQEWATSSPFQYFTDLAPEFGRLVTEGRRAEFAAFPEFAEPALRTRIPDPQASSTFERSRLNWAEQLDGEHARSLALYRALIALRRDEPSLAGDDRTQGTAVASTNGLVMKRSGRGATFWVAACLAGSGEIDLVAAAAAIGDDLRNTRLAPVLDTEHAEFAADPLPIDVPQPGADALITFHRPGAVILRQR